MKRTLAFACTAALLAISSLPATLRAEESSCERSGSKGTPSPDGQWVANVQQETGHTPWGPAAGVTVILVSTSKPARCQYVYVMPVPRSHDDWPRIRWNNPSAMEVRVSHLLESSTGSRVQHPRSLISAAPRPNVPERVFEGIHITVTYCDDNPADRASAATYEAALAQWQKDISAWEQRRKQDPDTAGVRPPRPEKPQPGPGRCAA